MLEELKQIRQIQFGQLGRYSITFNVNGSVGALKSIALDFNYYQFFIKNALEFVNILRSRLKVDERQVDLHKLRPLLHQLETEERNQLCEMQFHMLVNEVLSLMNSSY